MLKLRFPLTLFFVFLFAQSCGRLAEKFGRDKTQYTRVQFQGERDSLSGLVAQNGGVMIYFSREGAGNGGYAFGFTSETDVAQKSVVLLNGSYKVYAFGFTGSNNFEGSTRCALGNSGNIIQLSGATQAISLDLTQANCGFNTASAFSNASASDTGDFDTISVQLCSDTNHPSCTAVSAVTASMRLSLIGGEGGVNSGATVESPAYTKTSQCYSISGSSVSTSLRIPVGGTNFSAPVKIEFFGGSSSCATSVSQTYSFFDGGLKQLYGAASGSSAYLNSASGSVTTLSVYKNF